LEGITVSADAWFISLVVVLLASAIQAVTGFGFALIAVPILLVFLPAEVAVPSVMGISLACLMLLALRSKTHTGGVRVCWLSLGAVVGIPFGAYALIHLDAQVIRLLVSVVTLVAAAYFAFGRKNVPVTQNARVPSKLAYWITGCLSGFLTASVSMPGPPVILALSGEGLPKREFRATSVTYFAIAYSLSFGVLLVSGTITGQVLLTIASLIPVALLGNVLGDKAFDRVPQGVFDKAVPLLLTLTAMSNILRR